jgi:bla regulator protein blaR1
VGTMVLAVILALVTVPPAEAQSSQNQAQPPETQQTQLPAASGKPKAFEVASVRRSASDAHRSLTVTSGGRFTATGTTLTGLIMFAYDVGPDRLSGANGWMDSEKYDVVAKPPDGVITGSVGRQGQWTGPNGQSASWTALSDRSESGRQLRQMLQTLLADRFQLKLHRETRELPVYALVVAKGGPKLQPSKSANNLQMTSGGAGEMTFQGSPISTLAIVLTWMTGRPVLDRTGLTGNYDFTLKWAPDEDQMQRYRAANAGSPGNAAPSSDPGAPSIFTELQEQLGLRLESTKGPVETLVVDHAEKPSEN